MTSTVSASTSRSGLRRIWFLSFVALMLALTALFVTLGLWQLERLGEKEIQIAAVAERFSQPPAALPPQSEWASLDPAQFDFRPVTFSGQFVPDRSVMVFTSLGDAKGTYNGAGYWVMTPFALQGGGTVFVNRGFIPQDRAADFAEDVGVSAHMLTLSGVARQPEQANDFTPAPDTANGIDWVRHPQRLAQTVGLAGPVLAVYVDLPSSGEGVLPQGGETVIAFPNKHLEYAGTWFCFALVTPVMLVYWIFRQRRARKPEDGAAR
jgi:surfeit locus 1 family protein